MVMYKPMGSVHKCSLVEPIVIIMPAKRCPPPLFFPQVEHIGLLQKDVLTVGLSARSVLGAAASPKFMVCSCFIQCLEAQRPCRIGLWNNL